MNKRHYKVIFSRIKTSLWVVPEGWQNLKEVKAQSENVSSEQEKTGLFSTALSLNPIHFSLMLDIRLCLLSPSVHAEDIPFVQINLHRVINNPQYFQTGNWFTASKYSDTKRRWRIT